MKLAHIENLVRLETRNANGEGQGAIGIGMLIRAALRMRPDRIVIGEVRGQEAVDLLQAMNTGHDGSFAPAMPIAAGICWPGWRRWSLWGWSFPCRP